MFNILYMYVWMLNLIWPLYPEHILFSIAIFIGAKKLEDLQNIIQLYQMLLFTTNAWHQIVLKCKVISAPNINSEPSNKFRTPL